MKARPFLTGLFILRVRLADRLRSGDLEQLDRLAVADDAAETLGSLDRDIGVIAVWIAEHRGADQIIHAVCLFEVAEHQRHVTCADCL